MVEELDSPTFLPGRGVLACSGIDNRIHKRKASISLRETEEMIERQTFVDSCRKISSL